jgi:hypothetical protein
VWLRVPRNEAIRPRSHLFRASLSLEIKLKK